MEDDEPPEINFGPWGSNAYRYIHAVLSAAKERKDLTADSIALIEEFIKAVTVAFYDYQGMVYSITVSESFGDSGGAWKSIRHWEQGLTLQEGGVDRYEYGCDTTDKTVYSAGLEKYPDYDPFSFEMEEWMYQFRKLIEHEGARLALDSVFQSINE